jgi:hypothetical protein
MNAPLAYNVLEACAATCSGKTTIYGAIKSGELIARKRGRRTIILSDDLRRWLDSLPVVTGSKVLRKARPTGGKR